MKSTDLYTLVEKNIGHDQKAPSYGISFVNTQRAKHEGDGKPFIH
jgi:hypothetical protein